MKFDFSVVQNATLGAILELRLTLITARRAKDCCRSPLLVGVPEKRIYFDFWVNYLHNREPFN